MHILPENHSLEEILLLLLQPTLPKKHSFCEEGEPSSEEARKTYLKIIFYQCCLLPMAFGLLGGTVEF